MTTASTCDTSRGQTAQAEASDISSRTTPTDASFVELLDVLTVFSRTLMHDYQVAD